MFRQPGQRVVPGRAGRPHAELVAERTLVFESFSGRRTTGMTLFLIRPNGSGLRPLTAAR